MLLFRTATQIKISFSSFRVVHIAPPNELSDSRRRAPVERRGDSQITRDAQTESAAAVRCSALVRPRVRHHKNLSAKNPLSLEPNQATATGSRARTSAAVDPSDPQTPQPP